MTDMQWIDGGITAVPGILAAGITAGIKPSGKKDLALIYSSAPARAAAIFTTASVPLAKSASTADLLALYREFYAGEPFVRVLPEGERPTTRSVVGSNFCDVAVVSDPRTGRAVCVSALDNLGKGGSANGIQNLNIMMGWDERTGLEAPPVYP